MGARIRVGTSVGILGAALLLGCGGGVAFSDSSTSAAGGAGGGSAAGCPAEIPAAGAACQGDLACTYGDQGCPEEAACIGGSWQIISPHCVPTCPATQPTQGDPCVPEGQQCTYEADLCGPSFVCQGGQWMELPQPGCAASCPETEPSPGDPCSPCCSGVCSYPAVCGLDTATCIGGQGWTITPGECIPEPCQVVGNMAACNAQPACRWYEPGCGYPALGAPGCYDAGDCLTTGCPYEGACQTVSVDPCPGGDCSSCSVLANVCVWLGG